MLSINSKWSQKSSSTILFPVHRLPLSLRVMQNPPKLREKKKKNIENENKLPNHKDKPQNRGLRTFSLASSLSGCLALSHMAYHGAARPQTSVVATVVHGEEHDRIYRIVRCLLTQISGPALNVNLFQFRYSEKELSCWYYRRGGDEPSGCLQMTPIFLGVGRGLGEVGLCQEQWIKLPKLGCRKSEVNLGQVT